MRRKEEIMLLSTHGYFNIGVSVGIDDDVFTADSIQEFQEAIIRVEHLTNAVVHKYDAESKPEDLYPATGLGIHINLSNSYIAKIFLQDAINQAKKLEIQETFEAFELTRVEVTIFSLGIIYFCIEVEIGNIELHQKVIENISYSLQNTVLDRFSEALKEIAIRFVSVFGSKNNPINNISFRYEIREADRDALHYYITPSIFLLVCRDGDDFEKVAETVKGIEGESVQRIFKYGNSPIAFGKDWYILDKRDDEDYDRVMYLIELSQVFYAINEAFEELFRDGMKDVLKSDLIVTGKKIDARYLNQRRMLAATIIEATSYSLCASRSTDLDFLRHFEQIVDLCSKQNQIKYVADIFSQAQNGLNEIEEKQRGAKLNFFVIGLTTLTFLSVLADIINTVDFSQSLLPSSLIRGVTLSIPFVLLLLVVWHYAKR
jgi:hypothetical protein